MAETPNPLRVRIRLHNAQSTTPNHRFDTTRTPPCENPLTHQAYAMNRPAENVDMRHHNVRNLANHGRRHVNRQQGLGRCMPQHIPSDGGQTIRRPRISKHQVASAAAQRICGIQRGTAAPQDDSPSRACPDIHNTSDAATFRRLCNGFDGLRMP